MTPTAIPELHRATVDAFASWADDFGRYNDDRTITALLGAANQLADDLAQFPVAVAELQPGNGTRYPAVVARLDGVTDNPRVPWTAGESLGGQHCVSLPLQRRSHVLTLAGLWTPAYIKDVFRLDRDDDALLYAGLLSLTSDRLAAA